MAKATANTTAVFIVASEVHDLASD
jgi:hypothetical protein